MGGKRVKFSFFANNMILYLKDTKDPDRKLLGLPIIFIEVANSMRKILTVVSKDENGYE